MRKPVVGVIGGIGSGKSRVAEEFARHDGKVIAGDALGHEGLRQPEIRARVHQRWGDTVVEAAGEVNRRKLGAIVFADQAERRELEKLLFPWIERRIGEEIAAAQGDPATAFVVLDAAVLLEAGWNRFCDWIVYVDAPREERLRRLARQRGWSEKELAAREQAQWPAEDKARRADARLDNSGPPEHLAEQVTALVQRWNLHAARAQPKE